MSLRPYSWRQAILKSDLPATTRHVLLTISCHINDAGQAAAVSTATISRESGLSERAVISHVKAVMGKWLSIRRHGYGDRRWACNEYLPRLPDDAGLDVGFDESMTTPIAGELGDGTERGSVPPAESLSDGTERRSVPRAEKLSDGTERRSVPHGQRGTERDDIEALNVVQGDNGFVLDSPLKPPPQTDLIAVAPVELERWLRDVLWPKYPRRWRIDFEATLEQLRRHRPDAGLLVEIEAAVDLRLRAEAEMRARGDRFIAAWPHSKRWIRDRRWTDEAYRAVKPTPNGSTGNTQRACADCGAPGRREVAGVLRCRDCDRKFRFGNHTGDEA